MKKMNLNDINNVAGGHIEEVIFPRGAGGPKRHYQQPERRFVVRDKNGVIYTAKELGDPLKEGEWPMLTLEEAEIVDRGLNGVATVKGPGGKIMSVDDFRDEYSKRVVYKI